MPIIDRTPKMRDVIINEGDLVQGTSNGGEVRLPIGPVAGRIRRKLGDNKLSYDTSPHLNVRDYGAVGDGVTDDTVAIAACFSDSDTQNIPVLIPKGTYLTGTINYRMQSIIGTHAEQCILLGKPGQDILNVDVTYGQFTRMHGRWHEFTLRLNDSIDASASFPNRGGVGNACFAIDYNNTAAAYPPTALGWVFDHVQFASTSMTSGGLNKSAGIYTQSAFFQQDTIRNFEFWRLQHAWWNHVPGTAPSGKTLSHDHVNVHHVHFNLCKNNWRMVNWGDAKIDDVILHDAVGGTSWEMVAQATPSGSGGNHDLDISSVEMENGAVGFLTNTLDHDLIIKNMSISGIAAPLVWNAKGCELFNLSLNGLTGTHAPSLTINGHWNHFRLNDNYSASTVAYGFDLVSDLGLGNKVDIIDRRGSQAAFYHQRESSVRDGRVLHVRDSISHLLGHVDPPFQAGSDLILNPRTFSPSSQVEGVAFTYVTDTTADFGVALRMLTALGTFTIDDSTFSINGKNGGRVGSFLPKAKCRVYFKAKLATAGTVQVFVTAPSGGTNRNVGGAAITVTVGTAYTVLWFDADFSGAALNDTIGFRMQNVGGTGVTPLDIAWVAFRPWAADWLVAGAITSGALSAKTTTYTATESDQVIECDASGGAFTVNLPAVASTAIGKIYTIKKTDSSANAVTIDPNASETIDGSTTKTLAVQYEAITVVNNGATWRIENNQGRVHGTLAIDGATNMKAALDHDGTTAGFFNITPVTRPTAYTQTYATADKTHANFTSADLTGIASSTTGSALAEPSAAYTQAEMQQNFRRIQDQFVALRSDVADIKQLVNSVVDDLQALGLLQ